MAAFALRTLLLADEEPTPTVAPGDLPIRVVADISHQWKSADGQQVSVLRGNCGVQQGDNVLTAGSIVIWQSKFNGRQRLEIYLEDGVRVQQPDSVRSQATLFTEMWTKQGITYQARWPREYAEPIKDPLFDRAITRRKNSPAAEIRPAQLLQLPDDPAQFKAIRFEESTSLMRRVRVYARTGQPFSMKTERSTASTPPEQIAIITGGIKLNVDVPQADGVPDPKAIELAADSMVIWTDAADLSALAQGGEQLQMRDSKFHVYLEGNIVIRQKDTVLKADRAFYDAREDRALMNDAELKLWMPESENYLRVRADRIRQIGRGSFHAQNAWASGSYFGKPGYRVEASDLYLEPRVINPWIKAQGGWVDPNTGKFDDGEVDWLTGLNNRFVVGDTPFFYAPYLAGPAEDPHLPIQKAQVKTDRIFGSQLRTAWDPFHLLGKDAPEELSASLLLDYYSRRGLGAGLEGAYDGEDMFGFGEKNSGEFHGYYVNDRSEDNLGLDRRRLIPRDQNRGRLLLRHQHEFPYNISMFAETGYVSDRNFLEQWYENEFDQQKDQETKLAVEQNIDNMTWSLLGRAQGNGFENNTEWYPKGDLYVLGEPLFGSPVTWTMHSSAGYASLNRADNPTGPNDVFSPLPYVAGAQGEVLMSRHQLALPFSVGPVILAPYVMGEAARWGSDLTGNSLSRFVGTGGLRGSLSMWRVLPYVQSDVFNLNGLAHKMVFDFDYSFTDSSEDISRIAQYNEFDDNSQERFRQRFLVNTFGLPANGTLPAIMNPRGYAIRSGAGSLVSAPYHELVDSLHVLRFGWHHRLQTKVGPPDNLRTRAWMTLDLDASFFPNARRDNFGKDIGLLSARYSWLLSERTTLLSNALYDVFDGGQQLWNIGLLSQRSARGSMYVGVRQVKAQSFDSQIATASLSYMLSSKWVTTASTAYDLAEDQNRGQSLTATRIGADFLFHVGASFDRSKDSVGVAIALEPRFGPRTAYSSQMNSLLGMDQQ